MKKIAAILVTIACILGCILPAWGGKAHAYTYTVRIYSGEQGTIDGQDYITYTGLSYGDRITFDLGRVSLNDNSKYYVRGIRESGRDNNTVDAPSFIVEQDVDYVVAYGLMGDMEIGRAHV